MHLLPYPPAYDYLTMVSWSVNMEMYGFPHAAGPELDRLALGPTETLNVFERALVDGFIATEARVHVITGALKASGHINSSWDGNQWDGEIDFARYPGIFELARGDSPSMYHPEGDHYFFKESGPEFERAVRQAVWEFVGGDGEAPSGDLGPFSGGAG